MTCVVITECTNVVIVIVVVVIFMVVVICRAIASTKSWPRLNPMGTLSAMLSRLRRHRTHADR